VIGICFAVAAALIAARPVAASWCDDRGNVALAQGMTAQAAIWFQRGLSIEPASRLLREDLGRAILTADPAAALDDFSRADCGEPCTAERGDAEARLGRADAAVADYLAGKAATRLGDTVGRMAAAGRYRDAIALEQALIDHLDPMLDQADIAAADARVGALEVTAAKSDARDATALRRSAIASFATASRLAPLNEGYLLSLGYAQMQWGDRKAARRAFERVLELHPTQADAERGLDRLGPDR
jgi:tetratricopeptide (TPR) repeat protein